MSDYFDYKVIKVSGETFEQLTKAVLSKLPCENIFVRLVFFSKVENNIDYKEKLSKIRSCIYNQFTDSFPSFNLVAQEPLDCDLALEVHYLDKNFSGNVLYKNYYGINYIEIVTDCYKELIVSGINDFESPTRKEQSQNVFTIIEDILKMNDYPINSIVRQWNYIEGITIVENEKQNYQEFNDARSDFYSKNSWDNGYPSATGIGTDFGGITIDFNAIVPSNNIPEILPIDNKLQIPAHVYSDYVLIGNNKITTPKFERAKLLVFKDESLIYISGTAAIRGEKSEDEFSIFVQTDITIDNIKNLLREEDLKCKINHKTNSIHFKIVRVYLKEDFYSDVKDRIDSEYEKSEIIYIKADVCREELLIEIEGIAEIF